MLKAYKYRLYPNLEQREYLVKTFGCTRFIYNHFLNEKNNQYKETKKSDNYKKQAEKLTYLKNDFKVSTCQTNHIIKAKTMQSKKFKTSTNLSNNVTAN